MAKLYGEIAAKSLLTLDKSFARANGQPLDASEVYYSLEAAKTYAATAQAYIGQKIVVVEDGVVTHYGIEDAAGNLKELGSKPVGDEKSITVAENGTVSLKGIGTLVFERDILDEDGEPTGEKEAIQYQPLMTTAGLVWVEPSKTTVEGLATLIDALAARVKAIEDDYVTEAELAAAVKVEADRAKEAEKALDEKIDGIDFMDEDEVLEAIEAARVEISKEIDDDVKVAKDRADAAYTLAESKVDASTYATDKKALEDEDAAVRAIAEGVRDAFNTFMSSEDIDGTVNTLKEIQAEIDKMTDATELATAIASKAEKTYVDEELAKKQDVIAENTYDAYGSAATAKSEAIADAEGKIATAKQEAITAAATAAAGIYATQTALGELETALDERLDVLEAIDHEAYTTNVVFNEYKTTVENTYATKEALEPVAQDAANAKTAVGNLETRFDEIVAVGGEPNAINKIQVNGSELPISDKTVNIVVPTKASDLTDDTGFDARITAAQTQADKGVNNASAAQTTANEAKAKAEANEAAVGTLNTTVAGHTEAITKNAGDITALQNADIAHAAEYEALSGIVSGHTEAIAKKAEQTALDAVSQKVSTNETAIKTINETTIPAVNTAINKKADADKVYTKDEVDAITGTPEGKSLVDLIEEAKTEATYDDSAVKALIKTNADAIAVLNGDTETTGSVAKIAADTAKAEVAIVIGAAPEAMDTLEEVAAWINNDQSGAAAMAADISANKSAIATINNAETGILAQAKSYADSAVAGIPAATAEKLGLVKFDNATIKMNENNQLYVAKVSTDILEQGSAELVLNGGSAK
jgi:hypothetical protein